MFLLLIATSILGFNLVYADNPYTDAYLIIKTKNMDELDVSLLNTECDKCPFVYKATTTCEDSITLKIDTQYPSYYIQIKNPRKNETICEQYERNSFEFGEQGTYGLFIQKDFGHDTVNCQSEVIKEPSNRYIPIIVSIAIILGTWLVILFGQRAYEKFKLVNSDNFNTLINNSEIVVESKPINVSTKQRIESIDTLRGLALCIMIFVNYGSGGYAFFDHSVWNGLQLADLVFPCLIFTMGISIPLSYNAICNKARSNEDYLSLRSSNLLYKATKRSVLLFFFGLLLSNSSDVTIYDIRIFGVLQRFAVSYFFCALMEIGYLHWNQLSYNIGEQNSWVENVFEIWMYKIQWFFVSILTTVWLIITFYLHVPGCPTGYLGPGGLHDDAKHFNCTGGAAGYLDRLILGPKHTYSSPTCSEVYETKVPYDPEGILGCITSTVLCYLGVCIGHVFIHYRETTTRIFKFLFYATIYGIIALVLTKGTKNDGWIPINKNLWSLSFILSMASISLLTLVLLYLFIDEWHLFSGQPFIFPGKNSIFIYVCHEIFGEHFPVQFQVPNSHACLLSMHLYGVILWTLIAANMYHKKIFINL